MALVVRKGLRTELLSDVLLVGKEMNINPRYGVGGPTESSWDRK